jgi:murein DD-endopeptidase MepM/ murein hydrolase activator NlpD
VLKKRFYTFIIASHADATFRRISFPYSFLIAIVFFTLVGVISVAGGTYHYGLMAVKVADYNKLLAENNAFRAENQNYRIQTAQLGEKIDFLETTSRKLFVISGMDSERSLGGAGGYSKERFSKPLPASAGTLLAIDTYNRDVGDLENRFRSLKDYFYDRALVAAATPAFLPVKGYLTGKMGRREDPFNESSTDYHTGVDISAPYGSRVIAPADGTVLFAGQRAGYGNIVVVDHKFGIVTRYGHLWKSTVQVGQHVSRNDVIGYVGNTGRATGPHLHFEIWVHNRPVNPLKFVRSRNDGVNPETARF